MGIVVVKPESKCELANQGKCCENIGTFLDNYCTRYLDEIQRRKMISNRTNLVR